MYEGINPETKTKPHKNSQLPQRPLNQPVYYPNDQLLFMSNLFLVLCPSLF